MLHKQHRSMWERPPGRDRSLIPGSSFTVIDSAHAAQFATLIAPYLLLACLESGEGYSEFAGP